MARFSYNSSAKRQSAFSGLWGTLFMFTAVVVIFIMGTYSLSTGSNKRQKESLENAINRDVVYCYATTGAYPESLAYIKENYGLYYNEELFYVDYHIRGSNLFPDVTIIDLVTEENMTLPQRIKVNFTARIKEILETKNTLKNEIFRRRGNNESGF